MALPVGIPESFFTPVPDAGRVMPLRTLLQDNLWTDLKNQVDNASAVFPNMVAPVRRALDGLDPLRQIRPAVFTCHHQLATGISAQQPARVGAALGRLAEVIDEGCYVDGLTATSIRWDDSDAETLAYLYSPDGARTKEGGFPELWKPRPDDLAAGIEAVYDTLPVLRELDPDIYAELDGIVADVRLFRGRSARGMTSILAFGSILQRLPNPGAEAADPTAYFLDHLTHETSHLLLHTLMNVDVLLLNDRSERYSAPLRPDPRPLDGIYHATFVLSRVCRVLSRYAARYDSELAKKNLAVYTDRFWKGYETLDDHARLTDLGRRVLDGCRQLVGQELGAPAR